MGDKADKDAREIVRLWQANPGMGGEPDLQTRFASALRARDQELAQARAERDEAVGAVHELITAGRDAYDNGYPEMERAVCEARAALSRLPHASERAQAQRDVIAAVRTGAPQAVVQRALERLDALESGGGEHGR